MPDAVLMGMRDFASVVVKHSHKKNACLQENMHVRLCVLPVNTMPAFRLKTGYTDKPM